MNTQRVEGHTRLPWKILRSDGIEIVSEYSRVAEVWLNADTEANAAFIVHACNNIERLEKVNEALVKCLESSCGDIEGLLTAIEQVPGITTDGLRESLSIYRTAVLAAKEPA